MSNKRKICGIYRLDFPSGHYYFGQSSDIRHRFAVHTNKLKKGTHQNRWMLAIFNRYGLPTLTVLAEVPACDLNKAEQAFLDEHHGKDRCINLAPHADAPARGLVYSDAQREAKRLEGKASWANGSNALINYIGANTANLLRPDVREKIRKHKGTPESRQRDAETRTALHKDPTFKKAHSDGVAKHFADLDQQARRLAALKAKHLDPVFKQARAAAVRAACAKKVVCDETGQEWPTAAAWQEWVKQTYGVVASTTCLRRQTPYKGKVFRYG